MILARCTTCHHRIWPWQQTASVGVIGHSRRTAATVQHLTCLRERARQRHAVPHEPTGACALFGCTQES